MDLVERLKQASEAGEIITIVYNGGSQPGTKRQISPIKVTQREVRARDMAANEVKTFLVSKLEIVSENHPANDYVVGVVLPPEATNLVELLKAKVKELENLGWHVKLSELGVSVHRYFKNGKPRKGADVGIMKQEDSTSRPWYVWGPDLASARTFSHLDKVVALFLEQANKYAPNRQPD